jgi:hypothetical protein
MPPSLPLPASSPGQMSQSATERPECRRDVTPVGLSMPEPDVGYMVDSEGRLL